MIVKKIVIATKIVATRDVVRKAVAVEVVARKSAKFASLLAMSFAQH